MQFSDSLSLIDACLCYVLKSHVIALTPQNCSHWPPCLSLCLPLDSNLSAVGDYFLFDFIASTFSLVETQYLMMSERTPRIPETKNRWLNLREGPCLGREEQEWGPLGVTQELSQHVGEG